MLYVRKKRESSKNRLLKSIFIGIPAFLYSLWAVVGLGLEIILWGTALLSAGIPIYFIMINRGKN